MKEAGVDGSTPVTKNFKGISLRSALNLLLDELQLAYVVRDDVLLITTPAEADKVDKAIADYTEAIQLNPQYAEAYFNRGKAYAAKTAQAAKTVEAIQRALAEPTATEFVQTPFIDVVDYLKNQHHVEIQLASGHLYVAGVTHSTPVTLSVKGVSLRLGLQSMLKELKLTCTIRNQVLFITTPEEAKEANRDIADYNEAIRLKPDYAAAFNSRGLAYENRGEKAKAEEDYAKAKALRYKE